MTRASFLFAILVTLCVLQPASAAVRLKDIGRFEHARESQLVGYGVVLGLAGTGDSARSRATRQSLANLLSRFDVQVPRDQIQSRNVATVMVTANVSTAVREGDKVDVTVSSIGDAKSLVGGTLLITALKSPDGTTRAVAQGPLSVGGYRYDANGNVVQKNHPTTAVVTGGASVELAFEEQVVERDKALTYVLRQADLATAHRVARAIAGLPRVEATVMSASTIRISSSDGVVVTSSGELANQIELVTIEPDAPARVVVNERTGTVVAGGDVQISPVTITHGELKVSIVNDPIISQPESALALSPGVRTVVVPRTTIDVTETNQAPVVNARNTVSDLVRALNRVKIGPRDTIAILQSMKTAGALYAELIIQ